MKILIQVVQQLSKNSLSQKYTFKLDVLSFDELRPSWFRVRIDVMFRAKSTKKAKFAKIEILFLCGPCTILRALREISVDSILKQGKV